MALLAGAVVAQFKSDITDMKNGIAEVKSSVSNMASTFESVGNKISSIGKTMSVAITLPLVLYGKQAVEQAVEIESAWKRVQKVYDGTADSVKSELIPAARDLAMEFGRDKLEVIGVMEQLAAMGETGPGLIDKTRQAMKFATNGGLELDQALQAVVSTSAIFGVQGEELNKMLAKMNTTENAGAATMGDLAVAISTVGNVAKASGVSIDELNAFMSVLRKRAVDAGEGANALKSIFTRTLRPTEDAAAIMDKYGISLFEVEKRTGTYTKVIGGNQEQLKRYGKEMQSNVKAMDEYSKGIRGANMSDEARKKKLSELSKQHENLSKAINGASGTVKSFNGTMEVKTDKMRSATEVLTEMAKKWGKMTDAERQELSFSVGMMYQKDKFLAIMDDLNGKSSEYNRILGEQSDDAKNVATYQRELGIALDQSSTKIAQFQTMWKEVQQVVGGILVTALLPLLKTIQEMAVKFTQMNPETQKMVVYFGMLLAALGPILTVVGGAVSAFGALLPAMSALGTFLAALGGGPILLFAAGIGILVGAIIALKTAWDTNLFGLQTTWATVWASLQPLWLQFTLMLQALQPLLTFLWNEAIWPFLQWFWQGFVTYVGQVAMILTGFAQIAIGIFQVLSSTLIAIVTLIVQALTGKWTEMGLTIKVLTENIKIGVMTIFNGLLSMIVGWGGRVVEAIVQPFRDAYNQVVEWAKKIKEAAEEISPFKKHSPSLVELVTRGTGVIGDQYQSLASRIGEMDFRGQMDALTSQITMSPAVAAAPASGGSPINVTVNADVASNMDIDNLANRLAFELRSNIV